MKDKKVPLVNSFNSFTIKYNYRLMSYITFQEMKKDYYIQAQVDIFDTKLPNFYSEFQFEFQVNNFYLLIHNGHSGHK